MSIISEVQREDIPSSSTAHDVVVQMNERNQKLSIPADFHLLDISKDNDYMAVLQNDGKLVVYRLKLANGGVDYEGEAITYDAGDIEGANPAYVFLSVCSGTGDVVLSFAELDTSGLFATKTPEPEYRHCRIFRKGKDNYDTIKFQGRAVYTNKKLVLVGSDILQVHHIETLKMEYFLDFHYLRIDFLGLIGGESITQQVTWARRVKLNQNSVDDGARLISMTLHIHSNILVTSHKSVYTIVWSILDGSSIASFRQGKSGNFMAVSEDQQLIATYEKENKCVNVYFSKSGLRLYTYHHKGVNLDQSDSYVTSVKISTSLNYIAISDITKCMEEPAKYKSFYEVWSISQEQLFLSVEEKNVFKDAVNPFILDNVEEPNESRHISSTPSPQGPDNNGSGPENDGSGRNTPQPPLVNSSPKPRNHALYGIFTTENSKKLEFRTALIYNYDKVFETDNLLPEVIDWKDLQFKKLNEGVIKRGFLHDICDPLGGKNSVSYVLNHESGIYLLRFGACMTQLWKLLQIPNDRLEEAKKDKKVFDFRNLPSPSEKVYYNTVADNRLIFSREHPLGYTIFPTFRDTLDCCEPTFKFMKRDGHIVVHVKKEFNVYLPSSSNLDTGIDENDRQTETISFIEDLFLPLSKINSRDLEYELYEIGSACCEDIFIFLLSSHN